MCEKCNNDMNDRQLIFCGDIHGELKSLVSNELKGIENADLIVCGDFGVGFGGPNSMNVHYAEVEKKLKEQGIVVYAVRGNHDDPSYFDGQHDYELLKFLPDHTMITLCGKKIYPVGGAVSIDIDMHDRISGKSRRDINDNYIRRGSRRRVWWEREVIDEKTKGLPGYADIVVSHEAPLAFSPVPMRPDNAEITSDTWEKVIAGRTYLNHVLNEIRMTRWFYGHHHQSFSGHYGNVLYRGLGINELFGLCGE